jgi:hypothetical protein
LVCDPILAGNTAASDFTAEALRRYVLAVPKMRESTERVPLRPERGAASKELGARIVASLIAS